jgi:predicted transcriptional regulator
MTAKEQVLEIVNHLPNETSLQEISSQIALVAAVKEARDAADRGEVFETKDVRAMIAGWITES